MSGGQFMPPSPSVIVGLILQIMEDDTGMMGDDLTMIEGDLEIMEDDHRCQND
jgi:hypothetical protein